VPDGVNLEALKAALLESGMDAALLSLMSPVDLVNVARELKLVRLEEDDG
jgi:hypothetical protein